MRVKILVIRLSSFGDIVQSLSVVPLLKSKYPDAQLEFLTKTDFAGIVKLQLGVDKVIEFDKSLGFMGFVKLCFQLRSEDYSLVYDAHLNLRSLILKLILFGPLFKLSKKLLERQKNRIKRLLLFNFGIDLYKEKFIARASFTKPLEKKLNIVWENKVLNWNFPESSKVKKIISAKDNYCCLVLGANWPLKTWKEEYWIDLIQTNSDQKFFLIGAKLEEALAKKIIEKCGDNVESLVSKLTLVESCQVLSRSKTFISGDTGMLHVGDVLGVSGYALMGPTAFGYITSQKIVVLEDKNLKCRPCSKDGRGRCSQKVYKQCMVNLSPEMIHL